MYKDFAAKVDNNEVHGPLGFWLTSNSNSAFVHDGPAAMALLGASCWLPDFGAAQEKNRGALISFFGGLTRYARTLTLEGGKQQKTAKSRVQSLADCQIFPYAPSDPTP